MPRRLRTETIQKIRERDRVNRRYKRRARFDVVFTLRRNVLRIDILAHLTLHDREIVARAFKLIEFRQKRRIKRYELTRRFKHRASYITYFDSEFPTQHRRILRQNIRYFVRVRERTKSLRLVKVRSLLQHKPIIDILQNYIFEVYAIDRAFLSLTPEERMELVNYLIEVARGNRLYKQLILEKPLLRYLALRYILYYQEAPFTHNIYALRITPLMLLLTREMAQQYYIMRVLEASLLKRLALIGINKNLPFQFYRYFSKRGGEFINSMTYSSYSSSGTRNDEIICARNDLQESVWKRPLFEVVFKPHEIKRATVRALGLRELYDDVRYPSVYAMIDRRTRISKLYDSNANKVLLINKQRRRFKEIVAKRII